MDNKTHTENTGSNIFLTGCIFLANLDYAGLLDYAVKATIGGPIWLAYRLTADYFEKRKSANK